VNILLFLVLALCWMPSLASGADPPDEKTELPNPHEVAGTLWELNLANGKAVLRTDQGKSIYLEIRKRELFKNLSVGDRLTLQLNDDGEVDKVMGVAVPELGIAGQSGRKP